MRRKAPSGCAPAQGLLSLSSSCGVLSGFPPEQTADRRQGTAALQSVPEECTAVLPGPGRLGRTELCAHCALAAGLVSHGREPGRPRASGAGHLGLCAGHRLRQLASHGCALDPLHVPGQRGTGLVSGAL